MKQVITIGLDLAKHVFQVHGADAEGSPVFNRKRGAAKFCVFLRSCHHAWWGWKHAVAPTIGHARSQLWGMKCG